MKTTSLSALVDAIVTSLGLAAYAASNADAHATLNLPDIDKAAAVTLPWALNAGVANMYAGHRSHSSHSSHSSHASHYSGSGGSSTPSSSSSDNGTTTSTQAPLIAQPQNQRPSADELKI